MKQPVASGQLPVQRSPRPRHVLRQLATGNWRFIYEQTPRRHHRSGRRHLAGRGGRRGVGKSLRRQERHRPRSRAGTPASTPCGSAANAPTSTSPATPTRPPVHRRETAAQAHGPLRPVRHGGFAVSAVKDAGIDFKNEDPSRCGVVIGTGIGGIETIEEQNKILVARGVSRVSPFTVPRLMANAASGNVSILFHLNGPNTCVSTACATGLQRHRRCRPAHPARPGRRHDRRRQRGGAVASWAWRPSSPPAPSPPATTTQPMPAGPGTRTATALSWAKGPAWSSSKSTSTPGNAAPGSTPNWSATA